MDYEFEWSMDLENDDTDTNYIIDGLFRYGTINIIAADGGVGKTTYCLQMLKAIVDGEDFFGLKTHSVKCLWVNNELKPSHLKNKINDIANTGFDTLNFSFTLNQEGAISSLASKASKMGIQAIFIDSLAQSTIGLDENDNASFSKLFTEIRKCFCVDHNIAVFVIHHLTKSYFNTGMQSLDQSKIRGASSIVNNADSVLMMARMKNDVIKVKTAKTRWGDNYECDLMFDGCKLIQKSNAKNIKTQDVVNDIDESIIDNIKSILDHELGLSQIEITKNIYRNRNLVIKILNQYENIHWIKEKCGKSFNYRLIDGENG
jgi:predicted ATP-dependent serine protease